MNDFDEFKEYYRLSAQLIESMSNEELAVCLRQLALHVANYRSRFGEIPQQDLLRLLDPGQARLLRDGMELLTGYLASVRDADEDDAPPGN